MCIVHDDHIAIESPHPDTGCRVIKKDRYPIPLKATLESPISRTCRDIPLFVDGSDVTLLSSVERLCPSSHSSVVPSPPKVKFSGVLTLHSYKTAIARCSLYESLRSTILLV